MVVVVVCRDPSPAQMQRDADMMQAARKTEKERNKQTDKQMDEQTHTHTHSLSLSSGFVLSSEKLSDTSEQV